MRSYQNTNNLLIYLIVGLAAFGCQLSAQTLQDSLIAHYPFSNGASDISGLGHNGVVVGAIPTTDRFGQDSSAYLFDGIDDYIELPSASTMKPDLPVSISAWIQMDTASLNNIFTNNFDNNSYHGLWVNVGSNGKVGLTYGDGGPCGPGSRRSKNGNSTIPTGSWTHIVGVIRSFNDMEICVNGVADGGTYSGQGGGTVVYSNNPGRVACKDALNTAPPNYFKGKIDDIRFWNRALAKKEVEALYNELPVSSAGDVAESSSFDLQLWPNPSIGKINLRLPYTTGQKAIVKIFDSSGRLLIDSHIQNRDQHSITQFDFPLLSSGTYFVQCFIGDKKLVKLFQIR